jgi:hypothetical protein
VLEDIELSEDENSIYVKRVSSEEPRDTIITKNKGTVTITSCKKMELGFFSGKCLGFDIALPSISLNITRDEYEFKWLIDNISKEFPYCSIPILIKSHIKVFITSPCIQKNI